MITIREIRAALTEAFNDKSKMNQMGELQTTRYLKKDARVKKILGGRSLYWDDVDLIIGNAKSVKVAVSAAVFCDKNRNAGIKVSIKPILSTLTRSSKDFVDVAVFCVNHGAVAKSIKFVNFPSFIIPTHGTFEPLLCVALATL